MKKLLILLTVIFILSSCQKEEGYYLNVSVNPKNGGKVEYISGPYQNFGNAVLIPISSPEYEFVGWSGPDSDWVNYYSNFILDKNSNLTLNIDDNIRMTKDMSIVANFKKMVAAGGFWRGIYNTDYEIIFKFEGLLATTCRLGTAKIPESIYLGSINTTNRHFPNISFTNDIPIVNGWFSCSSSNDTELITIVGHFTSFTTCEGVITYNKKGLNENSYNFIATPYK